MSLSFISHPKTEIENCYPIKSPLPLREGARGRGNLKGKLFTLTLSLSRLPVPLARQTGKGRGNSFRISKSGSGSHFLLDF